MTQYCSRYSGGQRPTAQHNSGRCIATGHGTSDNLGKWGNAPGSVSQEKIKFESELKEKAKAKKCAFNFSSLVRIYKNLEGGMTVHKVPYILPGISHY